MQHCILGHPASSASSMDSMNSIHRKEKSFRCCNSSALKIARSRVTVEEMVTQKNRDGFLKLPDVGSCERTARSCLHQPIGKPRIRLSINPPDDYVPSRTYRRIDTSIAAMIVISVRGKSASIFGEYVYVLSDFVKKSERAGEEGGGRNSQREALEPIEKAITETRRDLVPSHTMGT